MFKYLKNKLLSQPLNLTTNMKINIDIASRDISLLLRLLCFNVGPASHVVYRHYDNSEWKFYDCGSPGAVVKATWKWEIAGSNPTLAFKSQRNKMFLPRSLVKILWGASGTKSVFGLRPPGLEFWIMWLEGSVISFISPYSRGSPGSD